ncbi:conserved hypothetical protein [Frankia sp. Hr75.2]|nr:conserved hypothetical protein [Frankia sp. Hr75.2]
MSAIGDHLAALAYDQHGAANPGFLSVPHRIRGRNGFTGRFAATTDDLDAAADRCHRLSDAGADVYVGVQILRAIPERGRGGAADTLGLNALAADIDIAGEGHATTTNTGLPLPATAHDALDILETLPDPTFIVWTGGGIHAWWLLGEHAPLPLDEARHIARGWGDHLRALGRERGVHVDQTGDLARVLRLPGTHNHKYADPPLVEVIGYGPRYDLVTLTALLPPEPPRPVRPAYVPTPHEGSGLTAAEVTEQWTAITDWYELLGPAGWTCCRDNGHGERHWTRPGKDRGTSAVSHDDPPVLHVFTSSTGLPADTLTRFDVYAHLHHGGDRKAAWRAIAPPLPDRQTVDVTRLARFIATGDEARTAGRLVWAARQIAPLPTRDEDIRALIRAAVGRGLPLLDATRATARALLIPERNPTC